MTALADPTTVSPGARLRWAVGDALAITRRNLTHVRHVPEKLIDVTLQPVIFVLLFAFVFGGAIDIPGGSYREYLMAGIFVQTLAFGIMGTAVGLADDLGTGVVDRFRSLPMARSAVLAGRALADVLASVIAIAVLTVSGLAVGWGMHDGVLSAIAGFALLLFFAYAMTWAGILLGLLVRTPDAAQGVVFIAIFPLTFLANTFVATPDLPDGLRQFAEWNPISTVVAALRDLFGNPAGLSADAAWPLEHAVPLSVAWCVAIVAGCAPLAVRRYRAATAR
jgi:ABC-2 type transport system permease protein